MAASPSTSLFIQIGISAVFIEAVCLALFGSLVGQVSAEPACYGQNACSAFRVFYGDDERYLDSLSPPTLLSFAARSGESQVVRLSRSSQTGIAQQDANLILDCSLWLSQFPAESQIRWYFIQLDEFGNISDPLPVLLSPENNSRFGVYGESNELLNISRVVVIEGAEDPDSKVIMCEVCTPLEECYTSNYTSRIIGVPPVITAAPVNLQLTERSLQQELSCGIQSSPVLYPTPVRSWFRNGELVYTAFHGYPPDVSDFIMKHTILMPGVLDPVVFIATSSGSIIFDTHVVNISQPMAIPSVTTVEGAREQVFNLLIGNWTCVVTNELGTDSVTHTFTSCIAPNSCAGTLESSCLVGWYQNSYTGQEQSASHTLQVGAICSEVYMMMFNVSVGATDSDEGTDFILDTTMPVMITSLDSPQEVNIFFLNDGLALEGTESIELRLVPLMPFNQTGIGFHDTITLTIVDSDDDDFTVEWLNPDYSFGESDGNFAIQIVKNKPIARHLSLFVNTLTVEEAEPLSDKCDYFHDNYSVFNGEIHSARVNEDFSAKSFFKDIVVFVADEGRNPVNLINVNISLKGDELTENPETFVATLEVLGDVCRMIQLTFITINADVCLQQTMCLPFIGSVTFPATPFGEMTEHLPCPNVPDVFVTRVCSKNGLWLEPHSQECSKALLEQLLMNKTSLQPGEAEQLTGNLSQLIGGADGRDRNQTLDLVYQVERVLETVGRFADKAVTEKVVEDVVNIVDTLQQLPEDLVQRRGSNIVMSFETITTNVTEQMNFTNLTVNGEEVSFFAERSDVETLAEDGRAIKFSTEDGVKHGDSDSDLSEGDISHISLPPSLFQHMLKTSDDKTGLVFTSYSDAVLFPIAGHDNNSDIAMTIGSNVIGATVVTDLPVQNIPEPVQVEFKVGNLSIAESVHCVSWDFSAAGGRGNWTTRGCQTLISGDNEIVSCSCNHLTNFGILMLICRRTGGCDKLDQKLEFILNIVTLAGVSLSIFLLFVTIITLAALLLIKGRSTKERERQIAVQFKFYIQLCGAMFCMYLVFIVGIDRTKIYAGCVTVSILIQYFTLTSVMWMSATCTFIFWIMVVNPFAKSKFNSCHMLLITILCWGVPVIPVVIPVAIDRNLVVSYSKEDPSKLDFCFIENQIVFFAAFLGPLLFLVLMNLIMYIAITFVQLRYICCTKKQRTVSDDKTDIKKSIVENAKTALKLWCISCLFGLTWLFGVFTVTTKASIVFTTLFTIFTSFQGLFVFVFLCVLSRDAFNCYRSILLKSSGAYQSWSEVRSPTASKSTGTTTISSNSSVPRKDKSYLNPAFDDDKQSAFSQELMTKVKLYEPDIETESDDTKTSTF